MVLFIGSCNGLVCVDFDDTWDEIILWNPSTREYKTIPKPPVGDGRVKDIIYGFGYDQKTCDYKLIRVVSYRRYDTDSEVLVYTLGSNSWKKNENIPYNIVGATVSTKPSNGAVHWVAKKGMNKMDPTKATKVIVSLDIAEEVTKEIQMPSCFKTHPVSVEDLGVLGEDLYLSVEDDREDKFDVWVMKEYGVADSWTKMLSVSREEINWLSPKANYWHSLQELEWLSLTPLQLFRKKGEILFVVECHLGDYNESSLVSYDQKNGKVSRISNVQDIPDYFSAETYVESLVSVNSGEYI
ncbi:F-box protein CPR1-like [Papaver somniferum]|uniref:F-box protein CPR1-like n=1 Tax=Papaver somniferum TaxID=3469 RepID=UPI000E6F4847|nr:F-box protein CPR1-like [Papaver somniferum]